MESIRIMSYNVCYYGNDTGQKGLPPGILDEKVRNLKTMLMMYGPDFVGLQEDYKYIDAAATTQARIELFNPVWRFLNGTTETTLRARYRAFSGTYGLHRFGTGRFYASAMINYTPTREKILFISCHLSAYSRNEVQRQAELLELFGFIDDQEWDHCIVAGDFNTNTENDRYLLRTLCNNNGFSMAIGSYLPWLPTCLGHDGSERYSFDNILVSAGMEIRKTMVLTEWYDRLYSDHVPVVCEVVL